MMPKRKPLVLAYLFVVIGLVVIGMNVIGRDVISKSGNEISWQASKTAVLQGFRPDTLICRFVGE